MAQLQAHPCERISCRPARTFQRQCCWSSHSSWELHRLRRLNRIFLRSHSNPGETGPGILTPIYKTFTKATINHFASSCPNVASSVVYLDTTIVHPGSADDGQHVSTLKQVAFWHFDDSGAVLYYDAWIPNLALWTTKLFGVNLGDGQFVNNLLAVLTNLCEQIQARCTGDNQQYLDVATCAVELKLLTRFGTFDEVWGNDVVCRLIHVILTKIRPEVHCPHVGPTGGGKCVDVEYDAVYID